MVFLAGRPADPLVIHFLPWSNISCCTLCESYYMTNKTRGPRRLRKVPDWPVGGEPASMSVYMCTPRETCYITGKVPLYQKETRREEVNTLSHGSLFPFQNTFLHQPPVPLHGKFNLWGTHMFSHTQKCRTKFAWEYFAAKIGLHTCTAFACTSAF